MPRNHHVPGQGELPNQFCRLVGVTNILDIFVIRPTDIVAIALEL